METGLWKRMARFASQMHNELGASLVTIDGHNGFRIIEDSKKYTQGGLIMVPIASIRPAEIRGNALSRKEISCFLWEMRKRRAWQRASAVVWTGYDIKTGKSVIGLGALVKQGIGARYMRKNLPKGLLPHA